MKPISKAFLMALVWAAGLGAARASDPLALVPAGDKTYVQLAELERTGLLPEGSSQATLSRQEVADRIFRARQNFREILVVQAEDVPPPPPAEAPVATGPSNAPAPAAAPESPAAPSSTVAPAPLKTFETPEDLARIAATLQSLEEAYQYELKKVRGDAKSVEDRQSGLESKESALWKRLAGITEYPTISWHGLGRAQGIAQQYYGDNAMLPGLRSSSRMARGFLDLEPMGVVDKQVRWDSLIRYESAFRSNSSVGIDTLVVRKANLEFNPPWLSATLGDFEQAYTPLTLWNRDNLDLRYRPEMVERQDEREKYESFFNHAPAWPFRGLRVGTDIAWPDSPWLDRFQLEGMVHMIRSGFNDNSSGGGYFGSGQFSDWLFAGRTKLQFKRWYTSGISLQLGVDVYGLFLDEPLYSQQPGSPYAPFNPATWAHQYKILSTRPSFDVGLGNATGFGGQYEGAFSTYVDDKQDAAKNASDFAILAGTYLRFEKSRITFNYLNVGPNYFSPTAQTRQDNLQPSTDLSAGGATRDLLAAPLRGEFFLTDVPRASAIFSFYDRTQDNTFPYGLATPNREGLGLELDLKTGPQDALKLLGSAYLVSELNGNYVVDFPTTAFVAVDSVGGVAVPKRNFIYVNLGPSYNLGPEAGLPGELTLGLNARFEQTQSAIGNLTSTWILGGVKAEVFDWWIVSAAFGSQQFQGDEAGYGGAPIAHYAYGFDNSDLTAAGGLGYSAFHVDGSRQSWKLATIFHINRNSNLYVDYDLSWGTALPFVGTSFPGSLNDQYMEMSYEIQF